MSSAQLVRHTRIQPAESVSGYVLRLAVENGYGGTRDLLHAIGLQGLGQIQTESGLDRLAEAAAWTVEERSRLQTINQDGKSVTMLLRHKLLVSELSRGNAKVCPECVEDIGYIEATWEVALFVACPKHRCSAVWFCPSCKKHLQWARRGMLQCQCGADIRKQASKRKISDGQAAVLSTIRTKALALPVIASPSFIPMGLLADFTLRELLSFITSIGGVRARASRHIRTLHPKDYVREAAEVLDNWPTGYWRLMNDLDPSVSQGRQVEVPQSIHGVWNAISATDLKRYEEFRKPSAIRIAEDLVSTPHDSFQQSES